MWCQHPRPGRRCAARGGAGHVNVPPRPLAPRAAASINPGCEAKEEATEAEGKGNESPLLSTIAFCLLLAPSLSLTTTRTQTTRAVEEVVKQGIIKRGGLPCGRGSQTCRRGLCTHEPPGWLGCLAPTCLLPSHLNLPFTHPPQPPPACPSHARLPAASCHAPLRPRAPQRAPPSPPALPEQQQSGPPPLPRPTAPSAAHHPPHRPPLYLGKQGTSEGGRCAFAPV